LVSSSQTGLRPAHASTTTSSRGGGFARSRAAALLLVALMVLPLPMTILADTALAAPDWPQARQNAARTGAAAGGTGSILTPTLLQQFSSLGAISASPLIVDLDGDGRLDVVVSIDALTPETNVNVSAFRGTASGLVPYWTFLVPIDNLVSLGTPFAAASGSASLAAGDLNGDGAPEVVAYSNYLSGAAASGLNNGRLTVLSGTTGAAFGGALLNDKIIIGTPAASPAIGDVTGDGKPDIVVVHQVGGTSPGYYLLSASVTGTTLSQGFDTLVSASLVAASPVLAELRSGHTGLEVVTGIGASNTAGTVWLCTPSASAALCNESVATTTGVRGISVADLDGDGLKEIVANGRTGASLNVIKTGSTLSASSLVSRSDGFLWNAPSLGDVDGDGKNEVVNVQYSEFIDDTAKSGDVTVRGFTGTSITTEGSLARAGLPAASAQAKAGGSLGDLNGDGRPELAFGAGDGNLVAITFSTASAPTQLWSFSLGAAASPTSAVAIGDVTGDGKADLVVGTADGKLDVVSGAVSVPGAPTGLGATPGNAQVALAWTAPGTDGGAAVTSYNVYRGTSAGAEVLLVSTGSAATSYTDSTVTNGVTYYYQVAAVNSKGEGARSSEVSATPLGPASPPSAPLGLTAKAGDQRATLVWNAPLTDGSSPITAYRVYRGTTSGGEALLASGGCSGLGNVLTCVDTGLTNNLTYFYQVSAANALGEGPRSGEASVMPVPAAPLAFQQYNSCTSGGCMGDGAGEPGVAVNWNTGNAFINSFPLISATQASVKVLRAQFNDTLTPPTVSWQEVSNWPLPSGVVNIDPVLAGDSVVGRVWAGGLGGPCSFLSYTDNDGQTWLPAVDPCALPGFDHPGMGSGPAPPDLAHGSVWPNVSQPRIVYYCAQPGLTDGPGFCAKSLDGGVTYANTADIPWGPQLGECKGLHGHPRVALSGAVAVPNKRCVEGATAGYGFAVSTNAGDSWTVRAVPGSNGDGRFDPSLGFTTQGWLYVGAAESDGPRVALTKDLGATWEDVGTGNGAPAGTKAFQLGNLVSPPVRRAEFAEVIAGDDQRAAFAFLGSSSSSPNAAGCTSNLDHVWYMYVALTYDAGKTWQVVKASDHPVQLGPIGSSGSCRDMLDFNDITVDARGRVIVAYSDGCVEALNGCRVGAAVSTSQRGGGQAIATLARQYSGKGLFAQFDQDGGGTPALVALPGGPYAGTAGSPVVLAGGASGGTPPYTFTWSVAARPSGSAAGTSSFSNPNAQSPTFTPDVAGTYSLRLSVQDAALGSATATATLVASSSGVGCASGGVVISSDSSSDGGTAGTASEALCLRVKDDAQFLDLYADLQGKALNGKIDSSHDLFYDFYFNADYAAGFTFLIEAVYSSDGTLTAGYNDPNTFLPIPGKSATAAFEGNTLHVRTARSEILSPANGQKLSSLFLDVNHCEGDLCDPFVHDDFVPDAQDGSYTLGSSGGGGGLPLPVCSVQLATDPSGDTTATAPGQGIRDLTRLGASDDASTWTVCFDVVNFGDRPTGAASTTTDTRFSVLWNADYEGPAIAYSARAVFDPNGNLVSASFLKGAGGVSAGALGGTASATVVGNQVRLILDKAKIGMPANGSMASGIFARVGDDGAGNGAIFDRAPDGTATTRFTFGQTASDTSPPSQVTGLTVSDPRTGTTLNLAWSAATDNVGVTSYTVKRSTTSGGPYGTVGTPSGTSFTDSGLTAGTTYYYVVSAKDAAGNEGPNSAQASGTPTSSTDTTPPSVPTNLAASGVTTTSATISWSPSSDPETGVKNYKVFRDGALVGSPSATSFTDSGLTPDTTYTYRVSAVNNVNLESAQSAPLSVHTLAPPAFVTITDPAQGAQVSTPATFKGAFSTTGQPPASQGGLDPDLAAGPMVTSYLGDPFVAGVLHSPEWGAFMAQMQDYEGFLAAYPSPEDGGLIVVQFKGDVPDGAPPVSDNGWLLRYEEDTSPQPLLQPLDASAIDPAHVWSLQQVEEWIAAGSPGTIQPGLQQGIGPGTGIRFAARNGAAYATFGCTSSFLFENAATQKYYLATAGHCLQDAGSVDATSSSRALWVDLCFRNCDSNFAGLGDYVHLTADSAYQGYHPVAWAHENGIGDDAGLIEVPASVQSLLRPWLFEWGGPTAVKDLATGDLIAHFGHGVAQDVPVVQGRLHVAVLTDSTSFTAVGHVSGGDSGSAISKGAVRTDKAVVGDGASGILTHCVSLTSPVCYGVFFGTRMNHALDMYRDGTPGNPGLGFRPTLVTEDATIRIPGAPPAPTLGAAITSPASGASFDPSVTPTVSVQGTASYPLGSAPGTGTSTYYLHRSSPDGCGGPTERMWMDAAPSAVRESGSNCGSVRDPAGPVVENFANLSPQTFPSAPPRTASAIILDTSRVATATLFLNASLNRSTSAAAPPGYVTVGGASVVNDLEVIVTYEVGGYTKEIGRSRLFPGPMLNEAVTPVTFSFTPQVSQVPAGADIRLTFLVHDSVAWISAFFGGPYLSRLALPLGTVPSASVQVSVDDASFAPSKLLTVTGTTSWTAPWSLGGVSNGPHTLYARAVQGSSMSSPVSITVNVASAVGPTAAFTSSVSGLTATFTDASTAGSSAITGWSWSFGDSSTSTQRNPAHTYAAGGTYTVTLTVTDASARTGSVSHQVTLSSAPTWAVQTRLTGPSGLVFDWTTVAQPADGSNGFWSQTWAPVPDPAAGTYTLEARLTKNGASVSGDARTFSVVVTNRPPSVNAGADQLAQEGALVALQGSAVDPNGDPFTVQWTQVAGPSVALSGSSTLSPSFTAPDKDADTTYAFRLTATDSRGASASDDVSVLVKDSSRIDILTVGGQNAPPANAVSGSVPVAGSSSLAGQAGGGNVAPQAVITNVVINGLDISASGASSFDPDGSIVSHGWALGNGDTRAGSALAYTYPLAGSYTLTLTVTDDKGASGQAQFGPFAVTNPNVGFVVDAGDSSAVLIGSPIPLSAQAFNNQGSVAFAWDTNGDDVPDLGGQSVQVSSTGRSPGTATFKVFGTDTATGKQGTDTVAVYLYVNSVDSKQFTQFVPVGVPDEVAGASGLDQQTFDHMVTIPVGAQQVAATLRWANFVQVLPDTTPVIGGYGPDDFDLFVFSPGGGQDTSSAGGKMPEVATVAGPDPGLWTFEVQSFVVADDTYTLWVNTTAAPPSPVPVADQVSEVCFTTPTQHLAASASAPSGDGITGAWDLDSDGVFETPGMTATSSFAVDSGAHLVRFRATSASGYRDTILVAVKVLSTCPAAPSVVVIGVADTGINPYASEFAGELLPYSDLRSFTTMDPANPGPNDVAVYHRITGQLLPFTRHPSEYIPGFPAGAKPLKLTLGGGFYKSLDDAAVWSTGHAGIPLNQWFWIPGTKIIAAVDTGDAGAINAAADTTPIYDEDGHGTASASVAVGDQFGSCPRCVLAFAEGLSGDGKFFSQPWIDFISVSAGAVGNVGTPDGGATGAADDSKAAAERGQTISYAAGNGVENAFVSPEQTYLSGTTGPDWHIRVGAIDRGNGAAILGTGKPVDWSSYGLGSIPSACRNSYGANCGHSGTSAATPISTGTMASVLLNARIAIGDSEAGQKDSGDAGGILQAVAVGDSVAGSAFLGDGVLQRAELWNATFHCASDFSGSIGFPGAGPRSAVDYAYGGYGVADQAAMNCASSALLGLGSTKSTPDADRFFDVDEAIRDALWGDWDGDGDGDQGGNFNHPGDSQLPDVGTLARGDVATLDLATMKVRDLFGQLGHLDDAPPVTETYYLHRDVCQTDADPLYMNHVPAATEEGGHGCAGIQAAMDSTWTATVTTATSFAEGSLVTAVIKAFTIAPEVNVVLHGELLSNGATVGMGDSAPETSPSLALVTTPCTEWVITFPTSQDIAEGATLALHVRSDTGTTDIPTCYEGGTDASRVSVTGGSSGGGGGGGSQPEASITSPASGAVLDPADSPVAVSGTASFPAQASGQTLFLRRDNCANLNTDTLYLSPTDAPDAGNGCALLFGAGAPALGFVERYPLVQGELPVTLAQGGTVSGTIAFGTDGADPAEVEFRLQSSAGLVGSQTVDSIAAGVGAVAIVPFSFPVANSVAGQSLSSLSFEIAILRQGAIHWTELDDPPSSISIPRAGAASGQVVQVAIDDATFGAGSQLTVSGTTSWSASWSLAGAAEGAHTIYARAGTSNGFGPASSVGVVVQSSGGGGNGGRDAAVQVQAVPSGATPSLAGWQAASSYDGTTGAWSFDWDTLPLTNGDYDVYARLLGDGVEEARDVTPARVGNDRAPVLDPIGGKMVDEGQLLSFFVTGRDPDGDSVTFSASGVPGGATFDAPGTQEFRWTPGFTQAGTYTVRFTITDSTGRSSSQDVSITVRNVNRAPVLAGIGDKSVVQGQQLTFTVSATDADGDPLTFSASKLPSGATFDAATRTFRWTPGLGQAGAYPGVTFQVSDGTDTDSEAVTITVTNTAPTAAGSMDRTSTDRLTAVRFTDASTDAEGVVATYAWSFGDGSSSNERNPSHTYSSLGTFTVRLTVADDDGATSTAAIGTVQVLNLPPTAAGSSDRATTDRLTAVRFTDASSDRDGTIASRTWRFGDGSTSSDTNPSHTYGSLGTFTPTLTAVDNDGASATATLPSITVLNIAPEAAFAVTSAQPGNRVDNASFEDQSTDRDGGPAAWQWDFGDGNTSTEQSPSHRYGQLGTFTVTLTVQDADGGSSSVQHSVEVVNLVPSADFTYDPQFPMAFRPVMFHDNSTDRDGENGEVVAWAWDFGDGTTSDLQDPVKVYLAGGVYHVNLTVTDADGATASVGKDVFVCSPGVDLNALLDLEHIRVVVQVCIRINGGDLPLA
jgi:PKD repeat protein